MSRGLQNEIFEQVTGKFSSRKDAVDALSELLSVGKDAVYRRLRGDTLLTPDELKLIVKTYNISLDAMIFEQKDTVFFTFNSFSTKITSFEHYLNDIYRNLEVTIGMPSPLIYYASAEIPVFYYCYYPELIFFKLYVWGCTIWNLPFLENTPFRMDLFSNADRKIVENILAKYNLLPSIELWSLNIVDNTLNQIEFMVNANGFQNDEDALKLCDSLHLLVHHMQQLAENGKKFGLRSLPSDSKTEFSLFHNEMVYTNNTILVKTDVGQMIFTTFENPNFLRSTDRRLCEHTFKWFQKVMHKSNPISGAGEKHRHWFFNRLEKKIAATRQRIELILSE